MNTKQPANKATYTRHSPEYKQEALKLAAQLGVAKAARHTACMNRNHTTGVKTADAPERSVNANPAQHLKMPA
jgi:transposase-like protein